jgi:hypothetical protein
MSSRRQFLTLISGLGCLRQARGAAGAPSPLQLLSRFNLREIGSCRWQRIRIETSHLGRQIDTWQVVRVWRSRRGGIETATVLEQDAGLGGTLILLQEPAGAAAPLVRVLLPTAREPLAVSGTTLHEGLLGSTFSHLDLAWRIYRPPTATPHPGGDGLAVRVQTGADTAGEPYRGARYEFLADGSLIGKAEFFLSEAFERPTKTLDTLRWERIDGIATPLLQAMVEHRTDMRTSLTLLEHGRCSEAQVAAWLSAAGLARLSRQARGGKVDLG